MDGGAWWATVHAEIQKIKRAYDEQLYGNKIDSLEEMEDS